MWYGIWNNEDTKALRLFQFKLKIKLQKVILFRKYYFLTIYNLMSRFSYSPQFTYQDKPKALFGRVWNKQILSSKLLIQSHDCPLALSKLRHKGDKHLELLQFTSFSIKFIIFAYFFDGKNEGEGCIFLFSSIRSPSHQVPPRNNACLQLLWNKTYVMWPKPDLTINFHLYSTQYRKINNFKRRQTICTLSFPVCPDRKTLPLAGWKGQCLRDPPDDRQRSKAFVGQTVIPFPAGTPALVLPN